MIEPARINPPRIQPPRDTVMATVLAFDPGGTTGWCAMSVPAKLLIGGEFLVEDSAENTYWQNADTAEWLDYVSFTTGEIDCQEMTFADAEHSVRRHNGLTIMSENRGVDAMLQFAIETYHDSAIVLEDFILDFKKADMKRETLSPVRLIASFSFGLYSQGEQNSQGRIFIQGRSNVKTTATDERLKNWGLYDRYSGRHARDATRHAVYFLRGSRGGTFEACQKRADAWPHLFPDPYTLDKFSNKKPPKKNVIKKLGERIHL